MSSLESKILPGVAAAVGFGAYAMPFSAPWYLLILLIASTLMVFVSKGRERAFVIGIVFVVLVFVLRGELSAPLVAACFAAAALALTNRIALAIGVLFLNLSAVATVQQLIGDLFYSAHIEAAAPAVLCASLLLLASTSLLRVSLAVCAGLSAVLLVEIASRIASYPEALMAFGATPVILLAAYYGVMPPAPRRVVLLKLALFAAASLIWSWTPPRSHNSVWVFLPEAPEAYEAKFFNNYIEALNFSGVKVKRANLIEDVPAAATILMPWVTVPLLDDKRIGELARQRHWTVVVGGEHTNEGDVASRVEIMSGRRLLRSDLTVPPGNTDDSGPMRSGQVRPWPHETILNRGASVRINSMADKVLLSGDGWWSEPDIDEWLWVGDYVWRHGDRAGRLAMASASDVGGARWIVLGDNSPLVNRQIVADPRGLISILQAATLWPTFFHDAFLIVLAVGVVTFRRPRFFALLMVFVPVTAVSFQDPSTAWKDFYVGQNGFDEKNFNNSLVENPDLIVGRRLARLRSSFSGSMNLTGEPVIMFLHIDGSAEIGGVGLDRCRRLGTLATSEGPFLMDAQACRVIGSAQVLIGNRDAAAAIRIGKAIVVLDIGFLGQKAPLENAKWLLREAPN